MMVAFKTIKKTFGNIQTRLTSAKSHNHASADVHDFTGNIFGLIAGKE